ncbi:MAG: hypothetical protein ACK4YF_06925 [Exilispira sp.]
MERKKQILILYSLIILFFIFYLFFLSGCKYFKENINSFYSDEFFLIKFKIKDFSKDLLPLDKIVYKLKSYISILNQKLISYKILFEKIWFERSRTNRTELVNQLKVYGKNYDDLISKTMLQYSSTGIPFDNSIIISIYTYDGEKIPNLTRFKKYHFKFIELSKEKYDEIKNQKMFQIEKNYQQNIKYNNLLFIKDYKLKLKNSKAVILCNLVDAENNYYLCLIENLPINNLPQNYKFYLNNKYPRIKFYTFYYYPLASSFNEVLIGFYLPISPVRFFSFFAIIFVIVIILLVVGYIILKEYLFSNSFSKAQGNKEDDLKYSSIQKEYKNKENKNTDLKNIEIKDKEIKNKFIEKMENIEKMSNNDYRKEDGSINEKSFNENKKDVEVTGKKIDLSEIPDFKDL